MPSTSSSNRNASIEKANRLLLAFSESYPELGVMELARRVGLNKSTVSRFVATLVEMGLLERVESSRKVRLGIKVFELGTLALRHRPIVAHAEPILHRLAERLRETVALAVPLDAAGGEFMFVLVRNGSGRVALELGRRYPATASASGIALLAVAPSSESTEDPALSARFAAARAAGYATLDDELGLGVTSIAAPIFDRSGQAVAAVSVVGAAWLTREAGWLPMRQAAADLSRRLGYHRTANARSEPERAEGRSTARSAC